MQRVDGIPVLSFSDVLKTFGELQVLKGVTFSVAPGELLVLLGPNGAGKSTAMSLATGLGHATSGEVQVFGHAAGSLAARSHFAFVPQDNSFPQHATARQILEFMAAHALNPERVSKVIEDFALSAFIDRPVHNLSGGQKRLLAIAGAFVRNLRFVIMDEPTVGLDVDVRRRLFARWKAFAAQGGTILMTTHHLSEAEELATRVVVLNGGRVVHSDSPAEIKRRFGVKRISFRSAASPPSEVAAHLNESTGLWTVDSKNPELTLKHVVNWGEAREIEVMPLPLEEVFQRVAEGQTEWV